MVAYLDSSVVLRHILLGEIAIEHAFACGRVVTSEMLEIECRRVLHRYRLNGDLDDQAFVVAIGRFESILAGLSVITLSGAVKARAMGSFPVVIKTLDALHLASALEFAAAHLGRESGETLLVFSHDATMNRCAAALGFACPFRTE